MCGCSSVGKPPTAAQTAAGGGAATQQAPPAPKGALTGPMQLPEQRSWQDKSIRDPALAHRTYSKLQELQQRFPTINEAKAAGYHPNPSSPDHYINDQVFKTRNGYDLDSPATLVYGKDGKLTGVMLSHDPRKGGPPDLGAGEWHTHDGTLGSELSFHVWFNKPFAEAWGGG